jgi:hypothetical protein
MTDSKVDEHTQILYQKIEISQPDWRIRMNLYIELRDAGFEICSYNSSTFDYIMGKNFEIPKAPEPPRPSCLG